MSAGMRVMIMFKNLFGSSRHAGDGESGTFDLDANTQAIMASSEAICQRADEFSKLLHGQRGDRPGPRKAKRSRSTR